MTECRCCRIVVKGNCKRHRICALASRQHECTYEPVAEKPIATKAKIQISSADSTIFMSAVVLGCVIPSMKRTAVQRAWMPMSCDTSPIHDGMLTMKTRKKTRPR